MNLRLTTHLFSKEVEPGVIGLYNNICGHNFTFVSKKMLSNLENMRLPQGHKSLPELVDKHFLVPHVFSETSYIESFRASLRVEIHLMYLLLSQSCNLSCVYCFEQLSSEMNKIMPWSVADRAIDYFFKISKPMRTIIFYGGEPLMNPDVFVKAVEKIRRIEQSQGLESKINMVCNGTLITRALAEFIALNRVNVSVSIDGPRNVHNRARVKRRNAGSYDDAVRGFTLLKQTGARASISCTIGDHNITELEAVAHFFVSELKPDGVGFNFMVGNSNNTSTMSDATQYLLKAYSILRDNGIYEDRIMRRLKPITNGEPHLKDCAAYGNQFAVRYDGQVGPCHAFCNSGDYFSGQIQNEDFTLNETTFSKWATRSQLNNPACVSCPASLVCGGGCAFNSQRMNGGLDEIDKNICTHSFMLLDWIMTETWKTKKGQQATQLL